MSALYRSPESIAAREAARHAAYRRKWGLSDSGATKTVVIMRPDRTRIGRAVLSTTAYDWAMFDKALWGRGTAFASVLEHQDRQRLGLADHQEIVIEEENV